MQRVHLQFLHLQQDYQYNLELLDGRDAELEQYDKNFDCSRQELAARDAVISQLRTGLAKADSGASSGFSLLNSMSYLGSKACLSQDGLSAAYKIVQFVWLLTA